MTDKPYRLWAGDEDNEAFGLQCLFTPKCPYCDATYGFWNAKPHRFSINDGDDIKRSHALDIEFLCPKCGHWAMFGVAISKEHFDNIVAWGRRQKLTKPFRPITM